jgi:hypothetical protein
MFDDSPDMEYLERVVPADFTTRNATKPCPVRMPARWK